MSLDVSHTIIAKSDQMNAVDLTQSETIVKIIDVKVTNNSDQPVHLHLEGHNGRPYKPCLSMRRILINAWGKDAEEWKGQSMALYCENSVKWAGKEVGGIRISRLTGIERSVSAPIAINRSLREIYTVEPLVMNWENIAQKHIDSINACKNAAELESCKPGIASDKEGMPQNLWDKILAAGETKKSKFHDDTA